MANKRYLVVHPKLSMLTEKGNIALSEGKEVELDDKFAANLIKAGKLKLVTGKSK